MHIERQLQVATAHLRSVVGTGFSAVIVGELGGEIIEVGRTPAFTAVLEAGILGGAAVSEAVRDGHGVGGGLQGKGD